jgi:hypothetical protein
MVMQVNGRIKHIGSPERGNSGQKHWVKVDFVIETEGTYPNKIKLTAWNVTANEVLTWNLADLVTVDVVLESKEFNGRWYTNVIANKAYNNYGR